MSVRGSSNDSTVALEQADANRAGDTGLHGFDRGVAELLIDRQGGLADGLAVLCYLVNSGRDLPGGAWL